MTSRICMANAIIILFVSAFLFPATTAFLFGLFTSGTSNVSEDSSCNIFQCMISNPCQNGGDCSLNPTDCSSICSCPPPFNDTNLYDQHCREKTGTSNGSEDSSCNIFQCMISNPCQNGGDCSLNPTDCSSICSCPPPFNDTNLYDQHCREKTACNSSSCRANPQLFPRTSCKNGGECRVNTTDCKQYCLCPAPYNDTRLYDERCDSIIKENLTCPIGFSCGEHGDCIILNTTGSVACHCHPGWTGSTSMCVYPCTRNCSNGGQCIFELTRSQEKCNCRYPWVGENCTEMPPKSQSGWWSVKRN